ncbi:hypothetical protein I302_108427 [Kwoniella bestiolae CBS 10118]|uniref:Uncharacterized protein n=1 Tax=Kwoniella bestiolae CBS 10118 TaxID=1296100 RepID=A0A1B9FVQ9_9TREE|nr:hypothetical protein I302_07199 [Kwoniella bestiolae CBS 10118]OCF22854.1 hypothetical protein I302_07199 [Kwoniella bestiolae CBS 10118]
MPIQRLSQEFKAAQQRRNKDPNPDEIPTTLFDRRRTYHPPKGSFGSKPSIIEGRKQYQEVHARREKEREEKEMALREKLGIGINDIKTTKANDIWDKDYVQRRPATLASQVSRAKAFPEWLRLAAERSDVSGLMAGYPRRHEVQASDDRQDSPSHQSVSGGSSFNDPPNMSNQLPYNQNPQLDRGHNMEQGYTINAYTDVHPRYDHNNLSTNGGNDQLDQLPPQYQQARQQYQHSNNYRPRAPPQPSLKLPYQPTSNSFPNQNPIYLHSNNNQWYNHTEPNQAQPASSSFNTLMENNPHPQWQDNVGPTYDAGHRGMHQNSLPIQPFDGHTPDATSTPQRDSRFYNNKNNYPSSDYSQGQQPPYQDLRQNHRPQGNQPSYPFMPNIPQGNQQGPTQQYFPQAPPVNITPSHQAGPAFTPRQNEPQVRFRSTPEVFHLPTPGSTVPSVPTAASGAGMTPIPSRQVQQTYREIHAQDPNRLTYARPPPSTSTWNSQMQSFQYTDSSGQPGSTGEGMYNETPPAKLQQAHKDIVDLKKRKKLKNKSSNSDHPQRLSKKVVQTLESMADSTYDELDLLRPDMLSLEDGGGDMSMAPVDTHRSLHSSSTKRNSPRFETSHLHGSRQVQITDHHAHRYRHDSTDDSETETSTDISDSSLSSSEEDDTYLPSSPHTAHSRRSGKSSHSRRSDSSRHSAKTSRGKKRGRSSRKRARHQKTYDHRRRKRARSDRPAERYPVSDDSDSESEQDDQDEYGALDDERYDHDREHDLNMEEDQDQDRDRSPPREREIERIPKPVKPLSAFANTVNIPPVSRVSTKRRSNANTHLGTNANTRRKNKRISRYPFPAQTEKLGDEIEGFSDEDQDMEAEEDIEMGDVQPQVNNKRGRGRSGRSENRWLRTFEEGERLSTVEEEDEEENEETQEGNEEGDGDGGEKGLRVEERTEEDLFWGDGGELGFKIWRDGY